jgi:hypothetical protein
MPIPVLVKVKQIRASATFPFPFRCIHCGFESIAKVRSKGVSGVGGNGFGEEEMEKLAGERALRIAEKNAPELAPLGLCPRCHGRDEAALAVVKRRAWTWTALAFLFLSGPSALMAVKMHDGFASMMTVAVGLAVGTWGGYKTLEYYSWKWTELPDRVEVMTERELAEALAAAEAAEGAEDHEAQEEPT